ncbi:MAG: TolC family protein [Variovorax sp.]
MSEILRTMGAVLCLAMISVSGVQSAVAAEPSDTQVAMGLSMRHVLQLAVDTHPSVNEARSSLRSAESQTTAAKLQFWPAPSVTTNSLSGNTATVVGLAQPLWSGGKLTSDLRYSEARELRAEEAIEGVRVNLGLRIASMVQSYLLNAGRRAAQERAIVILADLSQMILRRSGSEISAKSDINIVLSRQGQAQSDLELFKAAEAAALSQLGQALGRSITARDLALTPPTQDLPAAPYDLISRALLANTSIHLSEIDHRLAEIDVERTKAAMWPTVSVRAEHQHGEYAGSTRPGNRLYLSMQYSPGAGLSTLPQIEAAQQRVEGALQAIESARRDVSDRIDSEWREGNSARRRLPALESAHISAQAALESNRRLFVAGRRSWIDLLNSARELTQAEVAEIEAQSILFGSYYRLALYVGARPWTPEGTL